MGGLRGRAAITLCADRDDGSLGYKGSFYDVNSVQFKGH